MTTKSFKSLSPFTSKTELEKDPYYNFYKLLKER